MQSSFLYSTSSAIHSKFPTHSHTLPLFIQIRSFANVLRIMSFHSIFSVWRVFFRLKFNHLIRNCLDWHIFTEQNKKWKQPNNFHAVNYFVLLDIVWWNSFLWKTRLFNSIIFLSVFFFSFYLFILWHRYMCVFLLSLSIEKNNAEAKKCSHKLPFYQNRLNISPLMSIQMVNRNLWQRLMLMLVLLPLFLFNPHVAFFIHRSLLSFIFFSPRIHHFIRDYDITVHSTAHTAVLC